jgi:hypothetical protein
LNDVLGLLLLAVYIVGILAISAAITYAVVKIFPTERNPKKPDKPDDSDETRGTESSGGSLFRRSKRATT